MTDDQQRIDPRYDPAFQRGFAGGVKSTPHTETAVRRTALVAAAPYREAPDAVAEDEIPPGQVEAAPTRAARPASDDEVQYRPRRAELRRTIANPFLIAAAVLGLVLIVGAVLVLQHTYQVTTATNGAGSDFDYWSYQTSIYTAPLAAVLGAGIWAALLFVLARAWQRG